MKSEAAEQVAAPAESSNTQLAPGIEAHTECGWKGGDRDSAARIAGGGSKDFFFPFTGSTSYGIQREPSRLSASLRPLARRAGRGLDCAR